MSPEVRPRTRPLAALLSTLWLSWPGASAQVSSLPPVSSALCGIEENLAEVQVAGVSRGTYSLRQDSASGAFWLERRALQPGEEAYGAGQVVCDGLTLTRLQDALRATFDPQAQLLSFEPQLGLLPTQHLAVGLPIPPSAENLPVYALDYSLLGVRQGASAEQAGRLQGTYANGPLSVQAGLAAWRSAQGLQLQPSAVVRYQPSARGFVQAGLGLGALLGTRHTLLNGVQGRLTGPNLRYLPDFAVELPLPAQVTLYSGGVLLGQWKLGAGHLHVGPVPLLNNRGSVLAVVADAGGQREVSREYEFPAALLPAQGFSVGAEGGWTAAGAYSAAVAAYGLTPGLTLDAGWELLDRQQNAEFSVTAATLRQTWRAGLSYNRYDVDGLAARLDYRASLRRLQWGLGATVPVQEPQQYRAAAWLGYDFDRYATSLTLGYDPTQAGWYGRATLDAQLNPHLRLGVAGQLTPRSSQVQLRLGYTLTERFSAQVGLLSTPDGPAASLAASYRPSPSSAVQALYTGEVLYGQYHQNSGGMQLDLGASSSGQLSGSVQGSLVYAGGRLYPSAAQSDEQYVLVQTGVAQMRLYAGGLYKGTTDQRGELVFSVPRGQAVDLRVDLKHLPIEVSVQQPFVMVGGSASRAVRLDWRSNFQRLRFVSFSSAAGEDASYARLELTSGETYDLDAFGTGLLPAWPQPENGTLRLEGGQACPVLIAPEAQAVACSASASPTPSK
ncbi:hypothetical protein D3875_04240 [Deinococcus cavernae]|uniref:Fimbrial biogenesis outer membrane usher protein n=1 Tax=Deinococcus cavernae TaxID=2320857 RepID=A0A418VEG2_9DEIO|nr:hypothetical protein [Deinococcus cavernae]RJF74496.1 hypothetical protein D3875_04240 [Deinococcus cavernae]